jgi:hypothetical protein
MTLSRREFRRSMRSRTQALAWVFIASPLLVLAVGGGRYTVVEAAFLPILGVAMLLWLRRHPATVPAHLASVEYVQPNDYDGPDADTTPFYLAWCDCGWNGEDQVDEAAARQEARGHTPHVRDGLNAWGA